MQFPLVGVYHKNKKGYGGVGPTCMGGEEEQSLKLEELDDVLATYKDHMSLPLVLYHYKANLK